MWCRNVLWLCIVWADDPIFHNHTPSGTPVTNSSTTRPSQHQQVSSTPSSKRAHSPPATPAPPLTPSQKLKRLENIKAGLSQSTSSTHVGPSTEFSTPLSHVPENSPMSPPQSQTSPSQYLSAPLAKQVSRTSPEDGTDVFYTPPPSQSSSSHQTPYHLHVPPDHRSPKRAKLSHSLDNTSDDEITNEMGLLTPPQTSARNQRHNDMDDAEPQIFPKGKGKERDVGDVSGRLQGSSFVHFLCFNFPLQSDRFISTQTLSPDALVTAMEENLTMLRAAMEISERRRIAAQKSSDSKAKRIRELEQRVAELEAMHGKEEVQEQSFYFSP
jgi:hypothetical protein